MAPAARMHQRGLPWWRRHLLRVHPEVINHGCHGMLREEGEAKGRGSHLIAADGRRCALREREERSECELGF
jgi:hypothetical protein